MKRKINLVLASVIVFAFSLSAVANAVSIRSLDNSGSEIAQKAFAQIGSCLAPANALLNVLFVLDASSSLPEDTDKEGLRGDILAQAISQLEVVSENRPVNMAVSWFDLIYEPEIGWTGLNPKTGEDIRSQIPGWIATVASPNKRWGNGQGTNWEQALAGGAETMKDSPQSNLACKMIVWLTDGGINVDGVKENKAANKQAMENICGTNPVNGKPLQNDSIVAQLRASGTHLVGVLLKSEGSLKKVQREPDGKNKLADEESRFSYMLPVTEGEGPVNNTAFTQEDPRNFEYQCGNIPVPEGQALGALLSGNSPISLAFAFADLGNGIRGGSREDIGNNFPEFFDIEKGINAASIQLAGKSWTLTDPEGSVFTSKSKKVPGLQISQEGDLVHVRLEGTALPPGKWSLDVKDSLASAVVYREIRFEGAPAEIVPPLQSGELGEIVFTFTDEFTKEPVSSGVYKTDGLSLILNEGFDQSQPLECIQSPIVLEFTCKVTPEQVGEAFVSASLTLSTQSGKYQQPFSGDFETEIKVSAEFPSVKNINIVLTELTGTNEPASGSLTLLGPTMGEGQICLPVSSEISVLSDVMDRADSFTIEWPDQSEDCISLQQGEEVEVNLLIETSEAASGEVELSLPFTLKSGASSKELSQDVSAKFNTIREGTPNLLVFLGFIILGLGVPIGLLFLQARIASKLSLKGLQIANVPVKIFMTGDIVRIQRESNSSGDLFQIDDWAYFANSGARSRSFLAPNSIKLVAKTPKNPLGPLSAFALAPVDARVISSQGGVTDGSFARVGLSPANQWILSVQTFDMIEEREEFLGQLIAFANPSGGALDQANRELSASAQDGMLLGSLITVRDTIRLLENSAELKQKTNNRANKGKSKEKAPEFEAETEAQSENEQGEPSPFDLLLDGTNSSGNKSNEKKSKGQQKTAPPPASPDSGLNNPFEDL
jgi:hypothetical protein